MNDFADAGGALGRAADVENEARKRSDWYARYLWVFAAAQLVLVPMALLWRGLVAALIFTLANLLLVSALSVYAARQRVIRRGFGARHGKVMGSWVAAFALAVALSTTVFEGSVPFAVVATVWCALTPAVAAWRERRYTS
ncbi:hypothetical protein [Streptomyces sp. NPDC004726]